MRVALCPHYDVIRSRDVIDSTPLGLFPFPTCSQLQTTRYLPYFPRFSMKDADIDLHKYPHTDIGD